MFFRNAATGKLIPYGHREKIALEIHNHTLLHKNKQYQWLLVEAYEEFEDFLEKTYAYLGKKDNSAWPLNDFGPTTLPELAKKDFEWHLDRATAKKGGPESILSYFKNKFHSLKSIETNNSIKINMFLAITLISKLRHVIVHKGGTVSDVDTFIKKTLEKTGLYNSGRPSNNHVSFIRQYFGTKEHNNLIVLLEIRDAEHAPIEIYHDVLGGLFGIMMTYALLVTDELRQMSRSTEVKR